MDRKTFYYILLGVLLIGSAILYFFQFQSVPGGLFPDGAANGLDAQLILDGHHTPFFERGNGRESLFFYLMAGAIKLFGVNHWSILIPGIVISLLLILGVYLLSSEWFSPEVGLMAGLMTSVSYWLFTISRSGFRAVLAPLFLVYFLYFLTLAVKRGRTVLWASLSGLFFGLGFYSYISYRMIFAWVGFFVILLLLAKYYSKKKYPQYAKATWWFSLFAVISILPLAIYFINDPEAIVGRAGQVSIFNPTYHGGDMLGALWQQIKEYLLAFWSQGDLNWRHNVSGEPLVDRITGIFLFAGLVFFLIKSLSFIKNLIEKISFNGVEFILVFAGFWLMMVPGIMSVEGTPHGLRIIGSLPWTMIMAAWFLVTAFKFAYNRLEQNGAKIVAGSGLAILLAGIIFVNLNLFWNVSGDSSRFYYAFRKDLTDVSQYLNERSDKEDTFLVLDEFSVQTVEYLTSVKDRPYQLVKPEKAEDTKLKPGQTMVFTASTFPDGDRYLQYWPDVEIQKRVYNEMSDQQEELMRVYKKE